MKLTYPPFKRWKPILTNLYYTILYYSTFGSRSRHCEPCDHTKPQLAAN